MHSPGLLKSLVMFILVSWGFGPSPKAPHHTGVGPGCSSFLTPPWTLLSMSATDEIPPKPAQHLEASIAKWLLVSIRPGSPLGLSPGQHRILICPSCKLPTWNPISKASAVLLLCQALMLKQLWIPSALSTQLSTTSPSFADAWSFIPVSSAATWQPRIPLTHCL